MFGKISQANSYTYSVEAEIDLTFLFAKNTLLEKHDVIVPFKSSIRSYIN